ncbi:hypothetical protein PR202_ga02809 [Eleusine coracana subsp. coracana]|uniref:Uncharacterized protein n=1 Tax=Eleusine coracana subsp. coracana TaxID=191504 RepID=A0AAV5BKF6_ELECO|nr:hypothetical protein PR202_ga02809 [Eleusine coracana subsp. coracana]
MGNKANKQSKQAEGARCRRHPRHRQAGAGVCACCLQERLSRLSLSSSLPSVCGGEEEKRASSSCSEASTAYSSEGSTGCSSAAAESPGRGASSGSFHDEMRRSGRVSLLMKHERVVGDADAVAAFLQARREHRRTTAATSFWAKLLNAATRGGGAKARRQECSLAHSKASTLQERVAAAKWVLF